MAYTYTETFYVIPTTQAVGMDQIRTWLETAGAAVEQYGGVECDTSEPCLGHVVMKVTLTGTHPTSSSSAYTLARFNVYPLFETKPFVKAPGYPETAETTGAPD